MDNHLEQLLGKYPVLESVRTEISRAAERLASSFRDGNKLLICGNGGSAADADHIAGELLKGFEKKRGLDAVLQSELKSSGGERGAYLAEKLQQGLPAISLSAHSGLMTAVANDIGADMIFAQQVLGYGRKGDVLLAISTSGNSQNVIDAAITARAAGMHVIGLTGEKGGKLGVICDILINVPETGTAAIQELHLPVYHALCRMVEDGLFRKNR